MAGSGSPFRYHFLAHDQVRIGDLVLSIDAPWDDHRSLAMTLSEPADIARPKQLDVGRIRATATVRGVAGQVGRDLLSGQSGSRGGEAQSIDSLQAEVVELKNSGDKFENDYCQREAVQRWLERQCIDLNRSAYMIVAIYLLRDAQVKTIAQWQGIDHVELNAQPAGGGALTQKSGDSQQASFTAPGQQIFALEYRQVVFTPRRLRFLREQKGDALAAYLDQAHVWKIYGEPSTRGQRTAPPTKQEMQSESEAVYVEAKLLDSLEEGLVEEDDEDEDEE